MAKKPKRSLLTSKQPLSPLLKDGNRYVMAERIFQGDFLEVAKGMADGGLDLAFMDPPFNIGYEYDEYHDRKKQADYEGMVGAWMRRLYELLEPQGTFWLAIGDEQVSELDIIAKKIGFHRRSWVVWHYTFGVNCENKLTRSHAHLLYYTKHKEKFTFNPQRVPSARQLVYGDKRAKAKGRNPDDTWVLRPQWCQEGFYQTQDTWYVPRINGTFKERAGTPNQMPEQLLGRIINMCSNEGNLLFDPCSGSGSFAITAKKLGRKAAGTELSVDYARIAQERLEAAKVGDELAGAIPLGA
jgi:site-specific DNA-methyltransferase (adenine-specific)